MFNLMSVMINWRLPRPQAGGGQARSCHLSSSCSARLPQPHVELARPRPPLIITWLYFFPPLSASWENIYYRVKWRKQIFCSIQHHLQLLQQSHYLAVCQSQGSISTHQGQRKVLGELPGAIISSEPRWRPKAAPRRLSCSNINLVHATESLLCKW